MIPGRRLWWQLVVAIALSVSALRPCMVTPEPRLWAKPPGSHSGLFPFEKGGRVGFIDKTGRIVIPATIRASVDPAAFEEVGDFEGGLARIGSQGFIDERGNWTFRGKYFWLSNFAEGLARAQVEGKNYAWEHFFVNRSGQIVARVGELSPEAFSEGFAAFEAPGKPGIRKFEPGNFVYRDFPGLRGFLDRTGRIVIPARFAAVGPFQGGLARAVKDGYCHIEDPDRGRQGSPTSGIPGDCGGAPADALLTCQAGFINKTGSFVIAPKFESVRDFSEGLAAVRAGGVWGFINTAGSTVIEPRYLTAMPFREGLAAVEVEARKWGYVDRSGKLVIPAQFLNAESFSDSLALVHDGSELVYIDRGGHRRLGPFAEATPFVNGLAAISTGDNYALYIDHSGKTVFRYTRADRTRR